MFVQFLHDLQPFLTSGIAISSLGDELRYDIVKPILERCSVEHLLRLEQASPVCHFTPRCSNVSHPHFHQHLQIDSLGKTLTLFLAYHINQKHHRDMEGFMLS